MPDSKNTFVPSCLIVRDKKGALSVLALGESSDPVLAIRDELRKTKGQYAGKSYTAVLPIIRGKSVRQLHFA